VSAPVKEMKVVLLDGSERMLEAGATGRDLVAGLGQKLRKRALALAVGCELRDLTAPLADGDQVRVLTFDDPEGKEITWHSCAHLMAQAVLRLHPSARLGIGPTIEDGFYYDIALDEALSAEDLPRIEKEMRRIVQEQLPIERRERDRTDAIELFSSAGQDLKVEIIEEIVGEGVPSTYVQGEFEDLCRGPHLPSTAFIKHFKLLSVSGAYWRGDESRPMLTRIYGTAYEKKGDLDAHLHRIEEAKKRDHRKLGRELGLIATHPVAPGSPFFLPKGARVYNILIDYVRGLYDRYGYQEVITPQIFDTSIFHTSGHLPHYADDMFFSATREDIDSAADGERPPRPLWEAIRYGVKPMNCPGHALIFGMTRRSYRELPMRIADFGRLHRFERSGVIHGLTRVRSFCQDDAHIFCALDQMQSEIGAFLDLVSEVYDDFGFSDVRIRIATRPEDRLGSDEVWDRSESALEEAVKEHELPYEIAEGEGVFYGPKIEFHIKDAIGRSWQLGTIQADFNLPERFDLSFVDAGGAASRPVMLHRAVFGSIERFYGVLIEHVAGSFPTWLAPRQVVVLPITDAVAEYAEKVRMRCFEAGLRVRVDARNEKIGLKIREAEKAKVPFMFVVGEREAAADQVAIRRRGRRDLGARPSAEAIGLVLEAVREKTAD